MPDRSGRICLTYKKIKNSKNLVARDSKNMLFSRFTILAGSALGRSPFGFNEGMDSLK